MTLIDGSARVPVPSRSHRKLYSSLTSDVVAYALNLPYEAVFPIPYDVSSVIIGDPLVVRGQIE